MQVQQQPHLVDATNLWHCIFPESTPDCYTLNFFYSDEMNEARSKLIDFLFRINLMAENLLMGEHIFKLFSKRSNNSLGGNLISNALMQISKGFLT